MSMMPASRTRRAKIALAPDQANSGGAERPEQPDVGRAGRAYGPTGAASWEWNTAMNRVTAPSTRSS